MQTFEFQVKTTTEGGLEVPVKVTLEYPDNQGIHALRATYKAIRDGGSLFMQELADRGDLSLLEVMRNAADEDDDAESED